MDIKTIDDKLNGEKLLSYIEKNPDSYIGLFALFNQTFRYSYSPTFEQIKNSFGDKIKGTQAFQYYARLYTPDKKLENYIVYTNKNQLLQLNFANTQNRYTLLDFWALGCVPCLKEMEQMKKEYSEELKEKFDIITINIDEKEYFEHGISYLKKKEFPWKNYWDWDMDNIIKDIFFYYIPFNVLIDPSGKIIGENVAFDKVTELMK